MKTFIFVLLLLNILFVVGCSDATVNVTALFRNRGVQPLPGFRADSSTGVLTGGGLTLVGTVRPNPTTTLSGGGMTLSQGAVK